MCTPALALVAATLGHSGLFVSPRHLGVPLRHRGNEVRVGFRRDFSLFSHKLFFEVNHGSIPDLLSRRLLLIEVNHGSIPDFHAVRQAAMVGG